MAPFNGLPTPSQQVALAIIPKVTASLSFFGSAYITFDVLRPKHRRNIQSYQRLLVGMSICDLSMSGGIFMSTWPMPRDVPNVYGNVGTLRSCTAQGFFEQFGVSTVMYSASLSIYYLITIRSGRFKSQQKLHKVEPWLHIIPVAFGLGTAISSLALNLFNYGLWDCWIAPYPQGCKESWRNNGSTTCMRGDNASLYQWLFDLIPKWSSILIVTINMVLVYIFVRNQEIISERWSSRRAVGSVVNNSSSIANDGGSEEISSGEQSQENNTGRISLRRSFRRRRDSQARRRLNFSRQIAHQSYLYVGALWITWLPVIVLRVVQLVSSVTYYWLLVWVALSIPMHGFWNLLVYLRPRWLQKRKEHLEKDRGNLTPADQRDEAEESVNGRVSVGTAANRAATFLKALSVAAYDTLLEGDIPEAEVYEMSDRSNHNQVSGSDDFLEEGEMKRESVVKFAQDHKDEDDDFEEDNNNDDKETG